MPPLSERRGSVLDPLWPPTLHNASKTEAAMYDAMLVIMGLAMFAIFVAYAAACEKM
jgi:hypothetical protein